MKYVYYGFGGFIGFVCGMVINLIFYWLDQSGSPFVRYLIENYGVVGHYLLELISALPFIGIALGIVLVRVMVREEFEKK